jgi:hypothetical protein
MLFARASTDLGATRIQLTRRSMNIAAASRNFGKSELLAQLFIARSSMYAEAVMDGIIYLVGLIVIIMFVLSLLGLR